MRRPLLVFLVLAAVPAVAHATPVLEGADLEWKVFIPDPDASDGFRQIVADEDDRELERRFNFARCVCGQNADPMDVETSYQLRINFNPPPTNASIDEPVDIWVGPDCGNADQTTRNTTCGDAKATIADADDIRSIAKIDLTVFETINPTAQNCDRTRDAFEQHVWAVTDPEQDGVFDDKFSYNINVDTEVPPIPTRFNRAAGGEEAIEVAWDNPATAETDIDRYQMLCAKADGSPAVSMPAGPKRWDAPKDLCGGEQVVISVLPVDSDASAAALGLIDAGPVDAMPPGDDITFLPQALQDLDPSYICGEAAATANRMRIEGLENNVPYYFVLLAIDKAGNASGITFGEPLTPAPVTDFWEDLHENGSQVEGGFCLIADAYGDGGGPGGAITREMRAFRDNTLASSAAGRAFIRFYYDHVAGAGELARQSVIARVVLVILLLPLVAIALLWHALTLPGLLAVIALLVLARRVRLRRALVAAGAFGATVLAAGVASAQEFAPYWEDNTNVEETVGPDAVHWHVGVKVGPYLPEIDEQLGAGEGNGPYHQMFGGYNIMPMLEVDYLIWTPPGGQLGVGGTLGMLGKTGKALDASGRPSEDETKFRLLPLAATAIYRVTWFDDEYGIPVLPYLRAGLAYYIWWITKPSGAVADYMGDKGRGASMGVQASAGLAVRAENVDPAAAASMRDGGIYHAGFYGEFQVGWVDGFGSESKLAVGDKTWFAGVDFEF